MTQSTFSDLSEPQRTVLRQVPFDQWVGPKEIDRGIIDEGHRPDGRTASICHTLHKRGFLKRREKRWGRGTTSQYLRVVVTADSREAKAAAEDKMRETDPLHDLRQVVETMTAEVESVIEQILKVAEDVDQLKEYPKALMLCMDALDTDTEETRRLKARVAELEGKLDAVRKQVGAA